MLYPIINLDPATATANNTVLPPGNCAVIAIDMTIVQMSQIILTQISHTEDFGLRGWVSVYPAGISIIKGMPDYFSLPRMNPRPLVLYVPSLFPNFDCILAPL